MGWQLQCHPSCFRGAQDTQHPWGTAGRHPAGQQCHRGDGRGGVPIQQPPGGGIGHVPAVPIDPAASAGCPHCPPRWQHCQASSGDRPIGDSSQPWHRHHRAITRATHPGERRPQNRASDQLSPPALLGQFLGPVGLSSPQPSSGHSRAPRHHGWQPGPPPRNSSTCPNHGHRGHRGQVPGSRRWQHHAGSARIDPV